MKMWTMLIAVPAAVLASQAVAENWVTVAFDEDGVRHAVDKDSIRRGDDGLVYFEGDAKSAADCQRGVIYWLNTYDTEHWRDHGIVVEPGSILEAELKYVCANVK